MSNCCPICGEIDSFHYHSGWTGSMFDGQLEPEEEWCDFCGFRYQQTSNHNQYNEDIQRHLDCLLAQIDNIDNDIKWFLEFKKKIPELKKRIDIDRLMKELGWKKTKEGWKK